MTLDSKTETDQMTSETPDDEPDSTVEELDGKEPAESAPDDPRVLRRDQLVLGSAVVLALIAVVLGVWQGMRVQDQRETEDRRDDAIEVASTQALTLLGISEGNVDGRLKELSEHSTGDFKKQLASMEATFSKLIKKGQVTSSGEVVSAAVADMREEDARVMLALSSQVTNSEAKEPEPRAYRITVDLAREGDRWLVAGMQFAP